MNNPFELESCILHHLIKAHAPSRRTPSISNLPATLPPPSIFDFTSPNAISPNEANTCPQNALPNKTECAVHLELLEAFLVLKSRVLKSNALDYTFGIRRAGANFTERRKEKWVKFVELAVLRFEVWWRMMAEKIGSGVFDSENHLPPIDVLMVWHTYMLNPGVYREDLKKKLDMQEDEELRSCAKFPWKAIHEAIDHETREYTLTERQKREWAAITAMPDNLFEFLWDYGEMHEETLGILSREHLDTPGELMKEGYFDQIPMQPGEKELMQLYIRKDSWCIQRITEDFGQCDAHLERNNVPKALTTGNIPSKFLPSVAEMGKYLRYLAPILRQAQTLYEFRQKAFSALNDPKFLGSTGFTKQNDQQGAIDTVNWLFETYTRQGYLSGPSMDLKAAVQRQESFVSKMGDCLWIRSPYLEGTLSRALTRYNRFLELLRLRHKPRKPRPGNDKSKTAELPVVPAIDIDLVWHTHQLDPAGYYASCMLTVGKFVNHHDSLEQSALQKGWELTKEVYWRRFGVGYGACFCWFCEGIKSKSEATLMADTEGEVDNMKLAREVKEEVDYWTEKEKERRNQNRNRK